MQLYLLVKLNWEAVIGFRKKLRQYLPTSTCSNCFEIILISLLARVDSILTFKLFNYFILLNIKREFNTKYLLCTIPHLFEQATFRSCLPAKLADHIPSRHLAGHESDGSGDFHIRFGIAGTWKMRPWSSVHGHTGCLG